MPSPQILVFGKNGQLALALRERLGENTQFVGRPEVDFMNPKEVVDYLDTHPAELIINTSAYTAVDKAESEPEACDRVNHQTPAAIAQWVYRNQKSLVHFSSDYVFDGSGSEPRTEMAPPGPLSVYGRTKLAGDLAIQASGAKALILRTSWVYSHAGTNFFRTMLRLGAERDSLSVVSDQVGSPTYAPALAGMLMAILHSPKWHNQTGCEVYNVCGTGSCSWYEFATEIFRLAPEFGHVLRVRNVKAIPSTEYPTPARRPLNSRLSQHKLKTDFNLEMPAWLQSLHEAFGKLR